jgi:hypothetical protein
MRPLLSGATLSKRQVLHVIFFLRGRNGRLSIHIAEALEFSGHSGLASLNSSARAILRVCLSGDGGLCPSRTSLTNWACIFWYRTDRRCALSEIHGFDIIVPFF